jgi:membrane associated rhomboid family serine protease
MPKLKFYSLWFVLINIIIFSLQYFISGFTDLFVLNELALNGQVWRFITSIFLHGSITHLAYNMFALFFFGIALEKFIGSKRFLFVYFGSGIIANIISVWFYPSSLGASGAIMGVIGALTIIKPMMMVWAFGLILPMFIAAILWIAGDILGALGAFGDNGIGNIAHLSGVGVGLLIGLFLRAFIKKRKKQNNKLEIPKYYIENWENRHMR